LKGEKEPRFGQQIGAGGSMDSVATFSNRHFLAFSRRR